MPLPFSIGYSSVYECTICVHRLKAIQLYACMYVSMISIVNLLGSV